MNEIIKNKVYYKIFDKSFKKSSHIYSKKDKTGVPFDIQEVQGNRLAIIEYYKAKNICILDQVHGNKALDVDNIDITDLEAEDFAADGAVTTKENIILAVQTADCVPVLLYSSDRKVIGVAHCGWRGAKVDIVHSVVELMQDKGAEDIMAIIGPSIQQSSYEVDQVFYDTFTKQNADHAQFFIKAAREKHFMFDLPAFVEMKLHKAGVKEIQNMQEDTYTNPDKYISYRLATHRGELCNNRILSTIGILSTIIVE